jgi:hypothetical protein
MDLGLGCEKQESRRLNYDKDEDYCLRPDDGGSKDL